MQFRDPRIQEFLNHLRAERGLSANTISAYQNDLDQLLFFLREQFDISVPVHWDRISRDEVNAYSLKLQQNEYLSTTIARKIASVRAFLRFLTEEGLMQKSPAETIKSPRPRRTLPDILSLDEVLNILTAIDINNRPEGFRDRAMLETTYAAGLRVSEVVGPQGLHTMSLNSESGTIKCIGKGSKERIVPLYPDIVNRLLHYTKNIRPILRKRSKNMRMTTSNTSLFLNSKGETMTRQGFWLILKKYAQLAGVNTKVSPHILRHTFATHLLNGGASLRHVQELLGHASITATLIYTHLTDKQLLSVYNQSHPRA